MLVVALISTVVSMMEKVCVIRYQATLTFSSIAPLQLLCEHKGKKNLLCIAEQKCRRAWCMAALQNQRSIPGLPTLRLLIICEKMKL